MRLIAFDTIDSTNEAAKRLIRSGELREPCYFLAREQTAGRGRRGRRWCSPRDAGVYLTVVEFPSLSRTPRQGRFAAPPRTNGSSRLDTPPTTFFTLAAGVACVEALRETASVAPQLKPINDLYVSGRKLGGILTETMVKNGIVEAVVTGVGVNVRRARRSSRDDAVPPICLEEILEPERFEHLDMDALVATLVVRLRLWTGLVLAGQVERVQAAWERLKIPGTTLPSR